MFGQLRLGTLFQAMWFHGLFFVILGITPESWGLSVDSALKECRNLKPAVELPIKTLGESRTSHWMFQAQNGELLCEVVDQDGNASAELFRISQPQLGLVTSRFDPLTAKIVSQSREHVVDDKILFYQRTNLHKPNAKPKWRLVDKVSAASDDVDETARPSPSQESQRGLGSPSRLVDPKFKVIPVGLAKCNTDQERALIQASSKAWDVAQSCLKKITEDYPNSQPNRAQQILVQWESIGKSTHEQNPNHPMALICSSDLCAHRYTVACARRTTHGLQDLSSLVRATALNFTPRFFALNPQDQAKTFFHEVVHTCGSFEDGFGHLKNVVDVTVGCEFACFGNSNRLPGFREEELNKQIAYNDRQIEYWQFSRSECLAANPECETEVYFDPNINRFFQAKAKLEKLLEERTKIMEVARKVCAGVIQNTDDPDYKRYFLGNWTKLKY